MLCWMKITCSSLSLPSYSFFTDSYIRLMQSCSWLMQGCNRQAKPQTTKTTRSPKPAPERSSVALGLPLFRYATIAALSPLTGHTDLSDMPGSTTFKNVAPVMGSCCEPSVTNCTRRYCRAALYVAAKHEWPIVFRETSADCRPFWEFGSGSRLDTRSFAIKLGGPLDLPLI